MKPVTPRNAFSRILLFLAVIAAGSVTVWSQSATQSANSVIGTWKGESICVGNSRPACKNEVVVYRFERVAGKSGTVLMLADKIVNGKREAMGKLDCQYNEGKGEVACEFTINQTHGLWAFKLNGTKLDGTLVLLPGRELVRNASALPAKDSDLPPAPARSEYD